MTYTFEKGLDDIAECFARYHGMGFSETKEYFTKVGLMPFLKKYYAGVAYETDLRLVAWVRQEIQNLGQPLPKQIYFKTIDYRDVPLAPRFLNR